MLKIRFLLCKISDFLYVKTYFCTIFFNLKINNWGRLGQSILNSYFAYQ